MELFNVISVSEAKEKLNDIFDSSLKKERVPIYKALGRICGEDVVSEINIPSFRRSTVDGYAVRAKDTAGASESIPSMMNLIGEVNMGIESQVEISSVGECVYVPTGGMIPKGADSMVMIEYTDKLDQETILINTPAAHGDRIVLEGEDVEKGEHVIADGIRLRPYEIGLLSSLGKDEIEVYKKPVVGVISTGDEIVGCGEEPKLGQVRDMNSYILAAAAEEDGFESVNYGVVRDNYDELRSMVERALGECDVVLVSGGSSVGKKDQTLKVINGFEESEVLAHGISIKPGKPTIISKVRGKAVFGLPGHPLSCSIVYKIIVKEFIDKLINREEKKYAVTAFCSMNYHKAKGREEYLPVILNEDCSGKVYAEPVLSKSGLITGFTKAWGYVVIDKNEEGLTEGQEVKAYKF